MPTVYICHHVDTEGPLYEDVEASFNRLSNIVLGGGKISLHKTKENLVKLQRGEVDFLTEEQRQKMMMVAHPHLLQTKCSWAEIDEMQYRIMSKAYRNKFKDSYDGGWVFNWHIIDFVGYDTNPRHRDIGWHNIFDHYKMLLRETESEDLDEIEWHFHPMHHKKIANLDSTCYDNSLPHIHQTLTRKLIDRNFFPRVFRPGCHCERPDTSWFLEQWIPFDVANQSLECDDYINNGRFGDWTGAPSDWSIYHPDLYDWRKQGNTNRWEARLLNLKTRFRNITQEEVNKAFAKAAYEQVDVYLGVTDHDWREISVEIEPFYEMISSAATRYSDIKFKFSKSIEAFQEVLHLPKEMKLDLDVHIEGNLLRVTFIEGEPFGPQPYLAIKTKEGEYYHDNFDFGEFKQTYYFTFDDNTVHIDDVESLVVASNDAYGHQIIKRII